MSAPRRKATLAALCVALAGCATPLPPVVKPSLKCEIPPAMLQPCSQPIKIGEAVTYSQIIDIVMQDRENLRLCAQRQESLAGAAGVCKSAIDEYNKSIAENNPKGSGSK
jgi:hypothetical protein